MIAFRLFAITMAAGLSVASDPVSSVGMPSKAVFHEAIRSAPTVVFTETPLPFFPTPSVCTYSTTGSSFDYSYYENLLQGSYECALSLWQDVSHLAAFSREQVNNTDGSVIQVAKLSFQIFSTRLSVTFESGIVKDSPKASAPARFVSPEIIRILSQQCPLIETACEVDAMDTKPVTTGMLQALLLSASASRCLQDSSNAVLAWFANILHAPRAVFRSAITALTPKASAPARFVSPEILNILSQQCPLIVTTCEVDAMDAKPVTVLQALRVVYRHAITALTISSIAYLASGVTMLASKVYLVAILLALAHSLIDDVPVATTAMLIFGISIFAATLYFCAVTMKCCVKSPIKNKKLRVSNSTIAELCDGVFGYVRNVLLASYCIMFGSWQIMFGWVGDDPVKLSTQVVGTIVVAFIAKKVTEAIWYYYCLVWIHACASTVQAIILGPFRIAAACAKNAALAVLTGVFKVVTLIICAVLGVFRMAFFTVTAFVLRTVCGSFFAWWCEDWHLGKPHPACH
jgi:hypothetical protein